MSWSVWIVLIVWFASLEASLSVIHRDLEEIKEVVEKRWKNENKL